ncbi:MAG: NrdH-redoxin [Chloroflexi bacterium]|nr:NrdH-redoxin [Chloroflexota bacterium]
MNPIVIYGTTWCGDCSRAKRVLQQYKVAFEWINIEENPDGEAFVQKTNRGMLSVPVLVFADASTLVEPSSAQLVAKLKALQLA